MEELNESIINSEKSHSEKEEQVEVISSTEKTQNNATEEEVENMEQQEQTEEKYEEPSVDYSSCTREELVSAFKELLMDDVLKIKNRVADIKLFFADLNKEYQKEQFEAFLAAGGNKDEYQPSDDKVYDEYRKCAAKYREKRQKYQEEQESIKQRNLEAKKSILEELKQLLDRDDTTIKQTYDDFNALQEKWKTIGDVPRNEVNNLWQSYHFLIEKFFGKLKINRELRMLDLKRNLEQKIVLCEKVEELIMEESISESYKKLQQYREAWRGIGPVPNDKNEEIWARFCTAADQVENRRKEYYDQRKEELENNLLAKKALCEKAEELLTKQPVNATEWNDITTELNEMLKVWKTIGPVPREVNDEIWVRFKSKLDNFFENKKEYFESLKDEQAKNYNLKVELCLQAEAIAKRDDWKRATEELLKLQDDWKKIGSVSRKHSDKVWLRFRAACDEFFARKVEYYSSIKGEETENLAKKKAIIEEVKQFEFGEDKNENLAAIKEFQRRWVEVGHVPMVEKDALQKEFRNTINAHFEKLKISVRETQEAVYRDRLKNVASGDITKFVSDEKRDLQDKIQKLKSDLILWENNLGFLANSKQATLLREEFEKKMQSARQQIALLEAKIKILDEEINANKTQDKE